MSAYQLATGQEQWRQTLKTPVLCGCLAQDSMLVACSDRGIYELSKTPDPKTQKVALKTLYFSQGLPYAMTLSTDEQWLFVGDFTGKIEQRDRDGNLHKEIHLRDGAIAALRTWKDRLYVATTQGIVICLNQ